MRPLRKSRMAFRISASVFMTKGPYPTTGSSMGSPERTSTVASAGGLERRAARPRGRAGPARPPPPRAPPSSRTSPAQDEQGRGVARRAGAAPPSLPACSRRSQRSTGVNVRAGPLTPAKSPAITRTVPAPPARGTWGMLRVEDVLIAGRRHLEAGREVDPELDHLHGPSLAGELEAVLLFVHDPRGGRHPLDVARADPAVVAARVPVLDLALVGDGHRLETAVGVLAHARAARPARARTPRAARSRGAGTGSWPPRRGRRRTSSARGSRRPPSAGVGLSGPAGPSSTLVRNHHGIPLAPIMRQGWVERSNGLTGLESSRRGGSNGTKEQRTKG